MERKWRVLKRAVTPQIIAQLYYFLKHGALISGKAQVEVASSTEWGRGCVIGPFTTVKIGGRFVMGQRVQIGSNCFIGGAGLTIGDDVLVSPNCTILTGNYRYDRLEVPLQQQGTISQGSRIGHRVWIGANSVVLGGADIGDDVIVSAGSVVSGSVKANAIVMGNPAKVIFTRR